MLFELRSYDLRPGRALPYVEVFRSLGLGLITRHLPLGGYWMAETGRLNRLEHLWIYESLEERAACRSGLAEDKDWNEAFLPRAFPDLLRQENRFMVLERSSPLFDAVVASRRTRHANQGPEVPVFEDRFQALVHSEGEIAGEVQAAFRVTSGARPGTVVTLFAGDAGARMAPGGNVLLHQILRPLSFSPLR